jgi:hypothetical protein
VFRCSIAFTIAQSGTFEAWDQHHDLDYPPELVLLIEKKLLSYLHAQRPPRERLT